MKSKTKLFSLVSLGAFALLHANAAPVVIAEKLLDGGEGFGWNSNSGGQQIADKFSSTAGVNADSISFYGFYHNGSGTQISHVDSFDILFFDDLSGTPSNTEFYSFTTAVTAGVDTTVNNTGEYDIYKWEFSIPEVDLSTPGDYWVSVRSNSSSPTWAWSFSENDATDPLILRFGNDGDWINLGTRFDSENAFKIAGTEQVVPEPSTYAMFGTAFAMLAFVGHRARNRKS